MSIINIKSDIIFEPKSDAVPYSYRISYKISLLCLILHMSSRKGGVSITKIQIISSSISSPKKQNDLLSMVNGDIFDNSILIRFDPAINRAIEFALSDELICQQKNGLLKLDDKGKLLIKKIVDDAELFKVEKLYLNSLSDKLTESTIKELTNQWRMRNA